MRCALGVYGDNNPANTNRFDAMNGAPCAWIMGTIMDNRAGWANVRWLWDDKFLGRNLKEDWRGGKLPFKRWISFSIAIFPKDGNVDAAARGEYAKEWANQAQQLKAEAPRNDRGKISVRGDWEGNIGFYWKWSDAKRQQIIESWRQRHAAFEKVAPGLFEHIWCPNYAAGGLNVESFYPGDAYVDVIGMDHYWKHQWETTDPDTAWGKIYGARFGLKWQADFADAHGKMKEASEWAIPGDTKVGRSYLQRMRQHFIDREYCAAGYWDCDKDTDGRLSDNPAAEDSRTAFVELFGMTYLPQRGDTTPIPIPEQPAETGGGTTTPPPQPTDPDAAILDWLANVNGGAFRVTSTKAYPDQVLATYAAIEDRAFHPLAARSWAGKTGPAKEGSETDPRAAAALIRDLAAVSKAGWPQAAIDQVDAWGAKAAEIAGPAPVPDDQESPTEEPPAEQPNAEVEVLKEQVAALQQQLAAEQAARAEAERRLAVIREAAG
ncbi:MAG TPA: glycosyl hydrolase [Roseomonas sp.]|nr:glycosyl hydrolase [Roseomonas sp.]